MPKVMQPRTEHTGVQACADWLQSPHLHLLLTLQVCPAVRGSHFSLVTALRGPHVQTDGYTRTRQRVVEEVRANDVKWQPPIPAKKSPMIKC